MKRIILSLLCVAFISNMLFAEEYRVIKDQVKIYLKPITKDEIGYLTKGYGIKSLEKYDENWSYIDEGKIQGYIRNDGITKVKTENPHGKESYAGIIGLIVGMIIFGLILNAIYGRDKKTEIPQYSQNPLPQNTTFVYRSKSVGGAIILAALFGPLGMFYSTINGALIMIILPVLLIMGTISTLDSDDALLRILLTSSTVIFFIFYWFICIIWAAIAASNSTKIKKM
ncbi:hypothetical protein [Sphingobacterium lumbrici]|uniref:hypothetical protein n=1 Tax=Sphingobacterium lumbrici TaxID=2559600 RepID=UPI001C128D60|nr:hypothetical protein [Sphingobacterium lumbrici]